MSVFTEVGRHELAAWLARCGVGDLDTFRGVDGGVENTNYFVATDRGRFVLTLFEWMPAVDAARSLALTAALADSGLPVARPWPQADGWLAELAGKPAALAAWIDGFHPVAPTVEQVSEVGRFLGRLHVGAAQCAATATDPGPDPRGPGWLHRTAAALRNQLPADDVKLLDDALGRVDSIPGLPAGVIHADLFRDNALFEGDALNGVIDFHYACPGPLLYDVAVAALDWGLDAKRLAALTGAYTSQREPTAAECAAFPSLLVRAALRFWLSRAYDERFPRAGRAVLVKDPAEMREKLAAVMRSPIEWPE